MKTFLPNTKIKSSPFVSLPLSSLPSKGPFPRPFVPKPANINLANISNSSNTRSSTNFNQLNNKPTSPLQASGSRLTPLELSTCSNNSYDQQVTKAQFSNGLDIKNPAKKQAKANGNIKPQLSMATAFHHNPFLNANLTNKSGFFSKQYFLLKGQKMILERSYDKINEYINQIDKYKSLIGNSHFRLNSNSLDTYSKMNDILNSLSKILGNWNTTTYATIFKDLSDKTDILQSFLTKLNSIEEYLNSESTYHSITTSKSLSMNLSTNHFQNSLSNFNKNSSNNVEFPQIIIHDVQKIVSSVLSGIITISRVRAAICFSMKREKSQRNTNTIKTTPIGDFTESFLGEENDNSRQNEHGQKELISEIQKIDKNEENFICRICEEVVPLDLIEEHSALCIKAHQSQYHFYLCGERLKKVRKFIEEKVLSVNWPADQDFATSVAFPVIFYYSLIGIAIDVQNADCDANSQLETIIHELSDWEIPEAESKNFKLYIAGRQLVNKKLKFFNEIANAAKKISTTTRRHRASTTGGFLTNLSDFEFIARISSGAYARVFLSRKSRTGDLFAVKVIKREYMSQKNQIKAVSAERDIMKRLNSPFIVNFCMYFLSQLF
ncbi:Microtubule-associated serine/threonine-protein kinase 2 [Tritrichomonas musculus]|uniref:non-specific serine/threonine protein kinase n=1 Tax=Tritrichomonas musculus TaxID=1915356 RepID=A0ABR2IJV4_9EUKA